MALIGWAFAVGRPDLDPSPNSSTAVKKSLAQLDLPDEFEIRAESAEEVRETLLAADRELLQELAKRRAMEQRDRPSSELIKAQWQRRFERVKEEANRLETAEVGSVEWAYRQELIESLKDGPL